MTTPSSTEGAPVADLVSSLAHHATLTPDLPAYVDYRGTLTYGNLLISARRGAAWLARQGVREGDTVALPLDTAAPLARRAVELLYALAHLGAIVLPLFPEVPTESRLKMLARYGVRWALAGDLPAGLATSAVDVGRFTPYEPRLDKLITPSAARADAPFLYLFTSGTTGNVKAVLPTHAQFFANMHNAARSMGIEGGDRQMAAVPWPSVVGLRQMLHAHAVGATYIAAPMGRSLEELAATITRFGANRISASPWQLRQLLAGPDPQRALPAVRSLHVFGDFVGAEDVAAARARICPVVYVGYGCVEVGRLTQLGADEVLEPGCIGTPAPQVQLRITDADGATVAPGRVGELAWRTPWMCTQYVDNPQASAERFREGWFYPGDVGCIDAQGRVHLRGRSQDVVNHGGLKIWSADIEGVLREHPEVADAALVGAPDAAAGQIPVAFIVPRAAPADQPGGTPGVWLGTQWGAHWGDDWGNQGGVPLRGAVLPGTRLTEASLRAFCIARLESTRIPKRFVIVADIPRNEAGKILREELLARLR